MAPALPWISLGLTAVGTGIQYHAQKEQAKAQQRLNEFNAQQQTEDAIQVQQETAAQSQEYRSETEQKRGTYRSKVAKSGVEFYGSPLEVEADFLAEEEMRALEIERLGTREAAGLRQGAALSRYQGDQAVKTGKYQAFGTVMQGGANLAGSYLNFKHKAFL